MKNNKPSHHNLYEFKDSGFVRFASEAVVKIRLRELNNVTVECGGTAGELLRPEVFRSLKVVFCRSMNI